MAEARGMRVEDRGGGEAGRNPPQAALATGKTGIPLGAQQAVRSVQEPLSESYSVMSVSLRPHGLYSPWNSPGQNTGVGSNLGLPCCKFFTV